MLLATTIVLLFSLANSADPRVDKFDPVIFCREKARGSAEQFCGNAEFTEHGEITADTVSLVATKDAAEEASKACMRHFDGVKLNGVKEDDASVLDLAAKASNGKAQEFCQRVTR